MRISDWSSDVCSSDLIDARTQINADTPVGLHLRGKGRAVSRQIQRIAALTFLLGEVETGDTGFELVGIAPATALNRIARINSHRGVAHHGDLVAAVRRTPHRADIAHIAKTGELGRRLRVAAAIVSWSGHIHGDARGVAAVTKEDRKSVGQGKRVSVRVKLGGGGL